ncbi:MAG TPA: glycosyltransferase family 2 protein [Trueperaceae bacterium]
MQPYFSVVIPTYRRPELLREAVGSVLRQEFSDFELLVVDDDPEGSGRNALSGIGDARLRYLRNDRGRGGSGTRNAGIFRANGKWTAFLDDDDVWRPHKLAAQHRLIEGGGEDLVLVYAGSAIFDFDRQEIVSRRGCDKRGRIAADLLYRNYVGGLSTVAIRTDVLKAAGGFDERFPALQDAELYVRIAEQGVVDYVDDVLVWIRKTNGDRITRNPASKLRGSELFEEKYRDRIAKVPRLRHRAAARIFAFAAASGKWGPMLRAAPWTAAGLVIDRKSLRNIGYRIAKFASGRARGKRDRSGLQR